jgi:hypothetical protein
MKARIKQIVFKADVHRNKDKKRLGFQVPIPVVDLLDVPHKGPIALVIKTENGKPLYAGNRPMTSKCEVYGTDLNIKWGKTVLVEASAP